MGKALKTFAGLVVGATAAWAFAVKPRLMNKPDMSDIRRYDFARGGFFKREERPENSLAAIRAAIDRGYGLRLDVRLTRDGVPVIYGQRSLWRMCGTEGSVEETTLEELKKLRLEYTEEEIPTLREALDVIDAQVPVLLYVHVAEGNFAAVSSAVCEVVDTYDGVFAVEAVDPRVLKWFRDRRSGYIRGQVVDYSHSSGASFMNMLWDFFSSSMLLNFLTAPDYISTNLESRRNPSLWICRLIYRVQRMDWTVRSLEDYEMVKTDGSVAVFETIEP